MKITLKITFTLEKIFSSSTTTLEILQEHFNINIFLRFIFSVECKCFCRNSADIINTMENRAISLVKSSRDNESSREVFACIHTCPHTPSTTTKEHYGTYTVKLEVKYSLPDPEGIIYNYRVNVCKPNKKHMIVDEKSWKLTLTQAEALWSPYTYLVNFDKFILPRFGSLCVRRKNHTG